jgi:AraC family transcriptional regulator, regulatory protein of adaptative response / methylated-DNA-[protein]-cysteine methyltransferase
MVSPDRKNRVAVNAPRGYDPSWKGNELMNDQIASGRQPARDYAIIEKAIEFIDAHREAHPSLGSIAAAVNLSEFHFQRLFSRWVGISPKRFLQFLTKEHAKTLLRQSGNLLDATYEAGLSGPGRLHDLFVHCEAVTPGDYKNKGKGLKIRYGLAFSPFGECMIASTDRGICALGFLREDTGARKVQLLRNQWPDAELVEDGAHIDALARRIFPAAIESSAAPLHLHVKGTNFQIKVWEALLAVPFGAAVTYQAIADAVGNPGATRAVGTAIGKNPVAYLIPCHRVIRKMGDFGNYAGGRARKMALIGWESARRSR